MLKRLKSVSMMLFLMGASTGAAYAVSNPGITDVKIAQQDGACTGIVKDATGETVIGASVVVKRKVLLTEQSPELMVTSLCLM